MKKITSPQLRASCLSVHQAPGYQYYQPPPVIFCMSPVLTILTWGPSSSSSTDLLMTRSWGLRPSLGSSSARRTSLSCGVRPSSASSSPALLITLICGSSAGDLITRTWGSSPAPALRITRTCSTVQIF